MSLFLLLSAVHTCVGPTFRYGNEAGQPIYVEYDDNGTISSEICAAVGPNGHDWGMATTRYLAPT